MITTDGDPKLYDTGNGVDLEITNGQPTIDEGLQNAVHLSLFATSEWWGNLISSGPERTNSHLHEVNRRTLTNQTRLDAEQYARDALAWLVSDGVAKKVTVTATIPSTGMLGINIAIDQPDRTTQIKYQINWRTMEARVL